MIADLARFGDLPPSAILRHRFKLALLLVGVAGILWPLFVRLQRPVSGHDLWFWLIGFVAIGVLLGLPRFARPRPAAVLVAVGGRDPRRPTRPREPGHP